MDAVVLVAIVSLFFIHLKKARNWVFYLSVIFLMIINFF